MKTKVCAAIFVLLLTCNRPVESSSHRGSSCEKPDEDTSSCRWKYMVGGGLAAAVAAPFVIPAVLGAVGFTSAGVAAGSLAASAMSTAATSGAGGAIVATAQSIGAVGVGAVGGALSLTTGTAVGTYVGGLICQKEKDKN